MSTQAKARCGKASSGNGLWSHRIHPFFLCPSPKARESSLPREGPLDFRKGSQQPSAYDTGRDYGARRAPRKWPVGSSKNRPHGQLGSSPNTTPGEQRSEALAMRGGLSSWHWVYITRGVPGLGAGPREDGQAAMNSTWGDMEMDKEVEDRPRSPTGYCSPAFTTQRTSCAKSDLTPRPSQPQAMIVVSS